jgi:hypothetical protein
MKYISRFNIWVWADIRALVICFVTPPTLAYRVNLTYTKRRLKMPPCCEILAWVCTTTQMHLSLPVCNFQTITLLLTASHMEIIKVLVNKWLCVITFLQGCKNVLTTAINYLCFSSDLANQPASTDCDQTLALLPWGIRPPHSVKSEEGGGGGDCPPHYTRKATNLRHE